jgi:hypothetical protein
VITSKRTMTSSMVRTVIRRIIRRSIAITTTSERAGLKLGRAVVSRKAITKIKLFNLALRNNSPRESLYRKTYLIKIKKRRAQIRSVKTRPRANQNQGQNLQMHATVEPLFPHYRT